MCLADFLEQQFQLLCTAFYTKAARLHVSHLHQT